MPIFAYPIWSARVVLVAAGGEKIKQSKENSKKKKKIRSKARKTSETPKKHSFGRNGPKFSRAVSRPCSRSGRVAGWADWTQSEKKASSWARTNSGAETEEKKTSQILETKKKKSKSKPKQKTKKKQQRKDANKNRLRKLEQCSAFLVKRKIK